MAYLSVDVDIETNHNGIKIEDLKKYFQSLSNNIVSVGVHKDAGKDNVKKMLWNEFGTNHRLKYHSIALEGVGLKPLSKNVITGMGELVKAGADISIPARPVVRMYLYPRMLERIEFHYQNDIDLEKKSLLKNPERSANKVQEQLGEKCVVLQREKMSTRNFAPVDTKGKDINNNSRLTQKIKGYNQPYIETGELISKIDYKVRKRG